MSTQVDAVPSFCAVYEALCVHEAEEGASTAAAARKPQVRVGVRVTTDKDRAAYHAILEKQHRGVAAAEQPAGQVVGQGAGLERLRFQDEADRSHAAWYHGRGAGSDHHPGRPGP